MKTVLTIAGFDPSGGAGVTADLAVMAAMGTYGTSCITALTVQSTLGVKAVHAVNPDVVEATLTWLAEDLPPAGIKVGMLEDAGIVEVVGRFLDRYGAGVPVVLDPVVRSSSGKMLLTEAGVRAMRREMFGRVDWLTPNTVELGFLTGVEVVEATDVERAVRLLSDEWPRLSVVATGGHLDPPNDYVWMCDGREKWLPGRWIEGTATHGTGCAFSTALMCGLVNGLDGLDAARAAKVFVKEGIRRAERRGGGNGPMELYWKLRSGA